MNKQRWFYIMLVLFLAGSIMYYYRYPIVFRLQYSLLSSLNCANDNADANCLERLWVHRVNSIERYELLKEKFTGFETDIYFDDNAGFFVSHDAPTSNKDTLSINRFLQHVNLHKKRIWFDTRGVNAANATRALAALQATDKSNAVKNACIVELYDADAAGLFAKNGYTVSLNISTETFDRLHNDPHYYETIKHKLQSVKYVSQESGKIDLLKKFFPSHKIITWHLQFSDYFRINRIQKILDDRQVEIILLNIKSRNYR
jgi:hypothetical protein